MNKFYDFLPKTLRKRTFYHDEDIKYYKIKYPN